MTPHKIIFRADEHLRHKMRLARRQSNLGPSGGIAYRGWLMAVFVLRYLTNLPLPRLAAAGSEDAEILNAVKIC